MVDHLAACHVSQQRRPSGASATTRTVEHRVSPLIQTRSVVLRPGHQLHTMLCMTWIALAGLACLVSAEGEPANGKAVSAEPTGPDASLAKAATSDDFRGRYVFLSTFQEAGSLADSGVSWLHRADFRKWHGTCLLPAAHSGSQAQMPHSKAKN